MLPDVILCFEQRHSIVVHMYGPHNILWFVSHPFEAIIFNKPEFALRALILLFFAKPVVPKALFGNMFRFTVRTNKCHTITSKQEKRSII